MNPRRPARMGPALLGTMAREAVLSGTAAEKAYRPGHSRRTEQLGQLVELHEAGILTREEFRAARGRLRRRPEATRRPATGSRRRPQSQRTPPEPPPPGPGSTRAPR